MTKFKPIESEFTTAEAAAEHDAWVRGKVEKALASRKPVTAHDQAMAMARTVIEKHKGR